MKFLSWMSERSDTLCGEWQNAWDALIDGISAGYKINLAVKSEGTYLIKKIEDFS